MTLLLGKIVEELGTARGPEEDATFWSSRQRRQPPSREALSKVIVGFREILFPEFHGPPELTVEGVDYFVGHTLEHTLRVLTVEVVKELRIKESPVEQAAQIVDALAGRLPTIRGLLDSDIRAAYDGDPAAGSIQEIVTCYPGVTAILHHRVAHELYRLGAPLVARVIAEISHSLTAIDIHPGAEIGPSFFIDHGTGVVIGETAILGRNVRLYQGVTLGAKSFPTDEKGNLIRGQPRHPILEDDVVIYAGATVLGRITIGRGSAIGGSVWLTQSVPPGTRVTQAQIRRGESFGDGGGI